MLFQKRGWEKEDEIHHPFLFFSILSTPEFHGRHPRRLLLWYKYFRTSLRLSQFVYWPISILDFPLFDFCRVFIFLNVGLHIHKFRTILYAQIHPASTQPPSNQSSPDILIENTLPILSCVMQSVVCRNEILRFRLWFFWCWYYFFVRCRGEIQSRVWKQALMRPPNSVLTTRFII